MRRNGEMCIFHKWEKWSEVKEVSMVEVRTLKLKSSYPMIEVDRKPFVNRIQERYCGKCGKYQEKIVGKIYTKENIDA
jgi:hypothetical protein